MEKCTERKIKNGAENAVRDMKWHGEHVPYSVYEKIIISAYENLLSSEDDALDESNSNSIII